MNLHRFIRTLQVCYIIAALLGLFYFWINSYDISDIPVTEVALATEEPEVMTTAEPVMEEPVSEESEESIESETVVEEPSQEPSEAETVPEEPAKELHYTYIASHRIGRLFIRNGPSLDNDIIGFMKPGSTGDVLELGDEWSLIQYEGTQGYTFNGYLTFIPVE